MCALQLAFQHIENGDPEQIGEMIETKLKAIENVLRIAR
jgi:hypothetical protein